MISRRTLAAGPGWSVADIICTAGPASPSYEEQHGVTCIAAVAAGSFQYRTTGGEAVLAPGSLLLGNHGQCFECGHEHATGDRCLAFYYAPETLDQIASDVPGLRHVAFAPPALPPLAALTPLLASSEAARDHPDPSAFEELALALAHAVLSALTGAAPKRRAPRPREVRRVTEALRRIEAEATEPLALDNLARSVGMSPFHFLRTFRQLVGMTPHQFLLRTRLHRAAARLRRGTDPVSAIAFELGFGDLSTFNRQFRRLTGQNPTEFRARAR